MLEVKQVEVVTLPGTGKIIGRRIRDQLWLPRARPIAARASSGGGMRVVYDKEGTDPCSGYAHYCECVYQ
jgi:hypothetical protein